MIIEALLWNAVLGTALAVVVALRNARDILRRRPAVTHLLWFAVLLKLVIPPLVPLPVLPRATADVQTKSVSHRIVQQAEPCSRRRRFTLPRRRPPPRPRLPRPSFGGPISPRCCLPFPSPGRLYFSRAAHGEACALPGS